MTVTMANFTLAVQHFVKDSHAEFRKNLSNGLFPNTRSRTDGRGVPTNRYFYYVKNAARMLGLRVRIPPGAGCLSVVSVVCCQV